MEQSHPSLIQFNQLKPESHPATSSEPEPPSPRALATSSDDPKAVIGRLEAELRAEQNRSRKLRAELKQAKEQQVETIITAEAHEEAITNQLLKRLEQLQQEKLRLLSVVEQEEEYLTNTLQKKLDFVLREKVDLENQLEQEQEYIVNRLQKQLSSLAQEKRQLEQKLEQERETSNEKLKDTLAAYERERAEYQTKNAKLRADLTTLKTNNFVLQQKIKQEHEKFEQVKREKTVLEAGAEMFAERQFNEMYRDGPGRGGRARARSYSLPPEETQVGPVPAISVAHVLSSSSRSSASVDSHHISHQGEHIVPTIVPLRGTGRRRSSSGMSTLAPPPHLSPRSASKTLKSGWMKYKAHDDAPSELYFFNLHDSGLLEAFASDAFKDPNNTPVFTIHMDTIASITGPAEMEDAIVLKSNRGSEVHSFRCPNSDDAKEWINWFEMLNPYQK